MVTSITNRVQWNLRPKLANDALGKCTPGQVSLSTRDIRMRLPCKKLSPRYVGPFTITRQINLVTYLLQLPPQYRIHPSFHVSLLKPYHSPVSPSTEPGPAEPPLPSILEDGTIYKVNEILDSQRRGGQLEYLVDCSRRILLAHPKIILLAHSSIFSYQTGLELQMGLASMVR